MKYYIIAGEASGDLHGSNLIAALKTKDPYFEARGWGGPLMQQQGMSLAKHYKDLAFMGFIEVALNLKTILNNLAFCKKDILQYNPDTLILIDYPGFNLRIAKWAKQHEIKVLYYISPQIWAWKQSRVYTIKKCVDSMYVILPFEKPFYARFNYDVTYVGHPLLDAIEKFNLQEHGKAVKTNKPILALLPGSRQQEIKTMLPIMLQAAKQLPQFHCVIAGAPAITPEFYNQLIKGYEVTVLYNKSYPILKQATAALVTSGTATLETALFHVPQIVCYKGNKLSYYIARQLIKIKYISLVNLIMDKPLVTELIQDNLTANALVQTLNHMLLPDQLKLLMAEYNALTTMLGNSGASQVAANAMYNYLLQSK
ncbi:MAG: lipid-A-disaccharide synthase [Bacteroidia bacterium]|nr:lipid-A-disaccharide synthase [Bacteroidia bacterium]HQU99539.1 lipid-A-disaccharide synthase [Bacteroidia bacterium]